MAVMRYFVVLGCEVAGIYNSREDALRKISEKSVLQYELTEHSSLQDAFKCYQNSKSAGNLATASQKSNDVNNATRMADMRRKCSSQGTEKTKESPIITKLVYPTLRNGALEVTGCQSSARTNELESDLKHDVPIPQELKTANPRMKKQKVEKKAKPTTRNVCIQAERVPPKCKCSTNSKPVKRAALVDNSVQTRSEQTHSKSVQTVSCVDLTDCVCCMASVVDGVHISELDWDNLRSTPRLQSIYRV